MNGLISNISKWKSSSTKLEHDPLHSIIQIHNNVTWDWQYSKKYCQSHKTLSWIWIILCWSNASNLYYSTTMKPPTYLKSLDFLCYHFMWNFLTLFFGIELYQILQVILDLLLMGHHACLPSWPFALLLCILVVIVFLLRYVEDGHSRCFPLATSPPTRKMGLKWLLLFPD